MLELSHCRTKWLFKDPSTSVNFDRNFDFVCPLLVLDWMLAFSLSCRFGFGLDVGIFIVMPLINENFLLPIKLFISFDQGQLLMVLIGFVSAKD